MRVYRNNNYFLPAAVGCAALAFGLGLMSQFLRGRWRTRILVAGTLLLSAAIGISVVREVQTVSLKQRPRFDAVTMQRRGDQLVFETTVRTDAAQATDQLVVTGWGVPTVGTPDLLYSAKTGPDEDGHIAMPVSLELNAGRYKRFRLRSIFLGLADDASSSDCNGNYVNDDDAPTKV